MYLKKKECGREKTGKAKTLLTAKITMIQSVSEGFNLVPLMATCSQNTLATDFALTLPIGPCILQHSTNRLSDKKIKPVKKLPRKSTYGWISSLKLFASWLLKHLHQSHLCRVRKTRTAKTFCYIFSKSLFTFIAVWVYCRVSFSLCTMSSYSAQLLRTIKASDQRTSYMLLHTLTNYVSAKSCHEGKMQAVR